jgi:20S proteasome subunit alpha 7
VQADGRHLSNHVHDEVVLTASGYIQEYAVICSTYPMGAKILVECLGFYVQAYTLYLSVRPFGISAIHDHGPAVRT